MGKLEKVVVLLVLFLVAVILGVSLNASDGVAEAAARDTTAQAEPEAPMSPIPSERAAAGSTPAPARATADRDIRGSITPRPESSRSRSIPKRDGAAAAESSREAASRGARQTGGGEVAGNQPLGPGGVLSTSRPVAQTQGSEPAASQPARGSRPAASRAIEAAAPVGQGGPEGGNGFVLTLEDLAPSLSEEFMIYSWQDGDSFPKVAERYFGSRLHVNRLLRNNEGLDDSRLKAGDRILIPVSAPVDAASEGTGASTYTVQSGDVLGTISTTVYGTSRNWRKIYDANRDILADPNQLEVGMVLRIPE